MQPILSHLRSWLVPYIVTSAACVYTGYRFSEKGFWDGAVGNLLATILGIVIGIPVALHLERKRQDTDLRAKDAITKASAQNVAVLLRRELQHVGNQMLIRNGEENAIHMEPLRTSTWDAMRESGQLSLIANADLIDKVSVAYHQIAVLRDFERLTVGAIYGINVHFPDGENASTKLFKHSRATHSGVNQSIAAALSALAEYTAER